MSTEVQLRSFVSTYTLMKEAIEKKLQIRAVYQGLRREFCPHILGTKNDIAYCWSYQFGGESSRGPITPGSWQNWRCFKVDGLSEVVLVEGKWHTAPNRYRPQHCIDSVDVDVGYIPLD